ncbi:MAG: GAF domain-containing sensor histidine kinase [Anaerolineae bacterium]|nr:GAF domain-containing sensor histidine kinase [Anaerolineae bacterium]
MPAGARSLRDTAGLRGPGMWRGRESDFQALLAAARSILGQPDFQHAARAIFDACKSVTGATAGYVALLTPDSKFNSLLFVDAGGLTCLADESVPMPIRGMRQEAVRAGVPIWHNDFAHSPWYGLVPEGHCPLDNVMFVPLMSGGRAVGLLGLANKPGGFQESDAQAAEAFGELAAVALTHGQSVEELKRYAEKQSALYRVSSAAASSMDPTQLLLVALDTVLCHFGADAGWVTLPGATADDTPRLAASSGMSQRFIEAVEALPCARCPLLRSLFYGEGREAGLLSVDRCDVLPADVLEEEGINEHVTVPLRAGDSTLGALHIAWRAGRPPVLDTALALAVGQQVGLALHNAHLFQAALHADHLRTVNRLDQALTGSLNPEEVQERSLRLVAAALNARLGAVFVLERWAEPSQASVFTLSHGWVRMLTSPSAAQFVDRVFRSAPDHRRPVTLRLEDFQHLCPDGHSRLAESWGSEGLLIPVWTEHRLIAAMALGGRPVDRPLTADDLALAEAAGGRIGQAIENALLFQAVQRQRDELAALGARLAEAEEAERQRLARELHDQVGQNLTALGLSLNLARMYLPEDACQSAVTALDRALALVEETTESIRSVMSALRPPVLDDYGLQAALRWYGERLASQFGLVVRVEGPDLDPRLPDAVETAMFRVAQEALTNAARHASAREVRVSLQESGGVVRLEIVDDGVGFDTEAVRARTEGGGWGLLSMSERCAAVGGTFRLESERGRGTRVTMEIAR